MKNSPSSGTCFSSFSLRFEARFQHKINHNLFLFCFHRYRQKPQRASSWETHVFSHGSFIKCQRTYTLPYYAIPPSFSPSPLLAFPFCFHIVKTFDVIAVMVRNRWIYICSEVIENLLIRRVDESEQSLLAGRTITIIFPDGRREQLIYFVHVQFVSEQFWRYGGGGEDS